MTRIWAAAGAGDDADILDTNSELERHFAWVPASFPGGGRVKLAVAAFSRRLVVNFREAVGHFRGSVPRRPGPRPEAGSFPCVGICHEFATG